MANAEVSVVITSNGIEVKLKHWEGITATMIEHIHYAIIKEARVHQSRKLGAVHALKMRQDAAVTTDEVAVEKKIEGKKSTLGNFIDELGNAIRA